MKKLEEQTVVTEVRKVKVADVTEEETAPVPSEADAPKVEEVVETPAVEGAEEETPVEEVVEEEARVEEVVETPAVEEKSTVEILTEGAEAVKPVKVQPPKVKQADFEPIVEDFFKRYISGMATNKSITDNAKSQVALQKELYSIIIRLLKGEKYRQNINSLISKFKSNNVFTPQLIVRHAIDPTGKELLDANWRFVVLFFSMAANTNVHHAMKTVGVDKVAKAIKDPAARSNFSTYFHS